MSLGTDFDLPKAQAILSWLSLTPVCELSATAPALCLPAGCLHAAMLLFMMVMTPKAPKP